MGVVSVVLRVSVKEASTYEMERAHSFQVIGKAQPGDTLTILAELGEWYRVRTGTGLVGWVSKMLVTRVQSP